MSSSCEWTGLPVANRGFVVTAGCGNGVAGSGNGALAPHFFVLRGYLLHYACLHYACSTLRPAFPFPSLVQETKPPVTSGAHAECTSGELVVLQLCRAWSQEGSIG